MATRTRARNARIVSDINAALARGRAEVHDYYDQAVPVLAASLHRRMPGYRALGFTRA